MNFEKIFSRLNKAEGGIVRWYDKKTLSLGRLLEPYDEAEVLRIVSITDVNDRAEFADRMRAFVRTTEAVCHVHQHRNLRGRDKVLRAYALAKTLLPSIKDMREKMLKVQPDCLDGQIGIAVLVRDLNWALRVLEKDIPAWGY